MEQPPEIPEWSAPPPFGLPVVPPPLPSTPPVDRGAASPTVPPSPPPAPAGPARPPRTGRGRQAAGAVALAALAAAAGYAGGTQAGGTPTAARATTPAVVAETTSFAKTMSVGDVIAAVKASVVSIETTVQVRQGRFVQQGQGAGTGIVFDGNGDIVTNAHVVEGATSVKVTVDGETQARAATVVSADPSADIAVVRVDDPTGLVPAPLGDSASVNVGDQVVAIGNALALEGGLSVTEGIVSAVDRSIDTASGTLSGLLQTDAAISSGNSGGPLVDAAGRVIGINTAVASSSTSVQASNIGFAISIDKAKAVAEQLLSRAS